jgi:hypothetical protein
LDCDVSASGVRLDGGGPHRLAALRAGFLDKQRERHDEFLFVLGEQGVCCAAASRLAINLAPGLRSDPVDEQDFTVEQYVTSNIASGL